VILWEVKRLSPRNSGAGSAWNSYLGDIHISTGVLMRNKETRFVKSVLLLTTVASVAFLVVCGQPGSNPAPTPPPSRPGPGAAGNFRLSLSVSPFTEQVLGNGLVFTDGIDTARTTEELQRLFMQYGANEVYARIATTRTYTVGFGDHSLTRGLERARLAQSLGLRFNPELGLFNIYGDVTCQPPPDFHEYPQLQLPDPWTSLTVDQMLPILHSYGAIVAREILDTGVQVRIWDLGNEVDLGTAGVAPQPLPGACDDTAGGPGWYRPPDGVDPAIGQMSVQSLASLTDAQRIAWLQAHIWPNLSRMLAAVADGVRSVDAGARFSTHVSGMSAEIPTQASAFFQAMKDGGYSPDELGFSFYPSSSPQPADRLQAFQDTVTAVHSQLGRPVFIAEFGYPAETVTEGAFSTWNFALAQYPLTPQGQAALLRHLASWGSGAGVSGIRPWAPETAVPGWAPFSLFATQGNTATARPSLRAIADGLSSQ